MGSGSRSWVSSRSSRCRCSPHVLSGRSTPVEYQICCVAMADIVMSRSPYIDGAFVPGAGGTFAVDDPSTEAAFAEVESASLEQVDDAVAAARRAFDDGPWPRMSPDERAAVLGRMADALEARRDLLVETIIAEAGCPRLITQIAQVGLALQSAHEMPPMVAGAPGVGAQRAAVARAAPRLEAPALDPSVRARRCRRRDHAVRTSPSSRTSGSSMPTLATGARSCCGRARSRRCPRSSSAKPRRRPACPRGAQRRRRRRRRGSAAPVDASRRRPRELHRLHHRRAQHRGAGGTDAEARDPRARGQERAAAPARRARRRAGRRGGPGGDGVHRARGPGLRVADADARAPRQEGRGARRASARAPCACRRPTRTRGRRWSGPSSPRRTAHRRAGGRRPRRGRPPRRRWPRVPRDWSGAGYFAPTVVDVDDNAEPARAAQVFGPVITVQGYADIDEAIAIANDSEYGLSGGVYTDDLALGLRSRSGSAPDGAGEHVGRDVVHADGWLQAERHRARARRRRRAGIPGAEAHRRGQPLTLSRFAGASPRPLRVAPARVTVSAVSYHER